MMTCIITNIIVITTTTYDSNGKTPKESVPGGPRRTKESKCDPDAYHVPGGPRTVEDSKGYLDAYHGLCQGGHLKNDKIAKMA